MPKKTYPILIFTDGASSGNPGPGGWGSIIALPKGEVRELGGGSRSTTNNQMEVLAAIEALIELDHLKCEGPVEIYTDSVYLIRGITQWIWGWRKREWKTADGTEVANVDLWKKLSAWVARLKAKHSMDWRFVRGHSGIPGNERVDEIATTYARGKRPTLYRGPLLSYPIALYDLPENTELPEMKPRAEKKASAFSYLSLLGNSPMRHETWADCERRVKGRSGAKFKKAMSEAEEKAILAAWGYKPTDLD